MRISPVFILVAASLVACHETPRAESSGAPMANGASNQKSNPPAQNASVKLTSDGLIAAGPDGRRPVGSDPGGLDAAKGGTLTPAAGHQLAAFAGGCFWGVEDAFRQIPGVTATAVGFTGGHTKSPSYEAVCQHDTGHAETVLVEFDPKVITYEKLLTAFFKIHDPTTLNRQGPDEGDQYRSEVFTFNDAQVAAAHMVIDATQKSMNDKITTRVEPIGSFWKAEDYHQQYSEKTGHHGCPVGKLTGI